MTEDDRRQLNTFIRAVAGGSGQCLDGIYRIAGRKMYAVAYAILGNRAAAEDAVSDSFVKVARFAHRYKTCDDPVGWLTSIVRNTCLDSLRKVKRRSEVSAEEIYYLADDSYSPEKRESALVLEEAIKKLPPDRARAIHLRYFLDMTVREVAECMRLPRSTAERLIKAAEENLKNLLGGGKNGEDKSLLE